MSDWRDICHGLGIAPPTSHKRRVSALQPQQDSDGSSDSGTDDGSSSHSTSSSNGETDDEDAELPPTKLILRPKIKHPVPDEPITRCCRQKCWDQDLLKGLALDALRQTARERCISAADKRAYFRSLVHLESTSPDTVATMNGIGVCREFLIKAVGGSTKIISTARGNASAQNPSLHRAMQNREAPKEVSADLWLDDYKKVCEFMPDSGDIISPMKSKHSVYLNYIDHQKRLDLPTCSESHFMTVWERRHPEFKISKNCHLVKCSVCVKLNELHAGTTDMWFQSQINKARQSHNDDQTLQRRDYDRAGAQCAAAHALLKHHMVGGVMPPEINFVPPPLVLSFDGASFERGVPHFDQECKDTGGPGALPLTLVGAKMHGVFFGVFTILKNLVGGANASISVVHYMMTEYRRRYRRWPQRLRLQLDNTAKDNKNFALLGYLACLVQRGFMECIEVHYLLKGHTHNDVDGTFGNLKTYMDTHGVYSRPHIAEVFAKAATTLQIVPFHLDHLANVTGLLEPHLVKWNHITYPQAFQLKKHENGDVVCNFKHRSASHNEELKYWGGMRVTTKDGKKGIQISPMNRGQVILQKDESGCWPDFEDIPDSVSQPIAEKKMEAMTKYLTDPVILERIKIKEPQRYQEFWDSLQEDLEKSQDEGDTACPWELDVYEHDAQFDANTPFVNADPNFNAPFDPDEPLIETGDQRKKIKLITLSTDDTFKPGQFWMFKADKPLPWYLGEIVGEAVWVKNPDDPEDNIPEVLVQWWVPARGNYARHYNEKSWFVPAKRREKGQVVLWRNKVDLRTREDRIHPIRGTDPNQVRVSSKHMEK